MNRRIMAPAALAVAGLLLAACSRGQTQCPAPTALATPSTHSSTQTTPTTPPKAHGALPTIKGAAVTQIAGEPDDEYNRTYTCNPELTTVELPMGQTIDGSDGSKYSLTEDEQDAAVSILSIKLGHQAVPAVIINPVAHAEAPGDYPQTTMRLNLGPGSSGSYRLNIYAYTTNYFDNGFASVILCVNQG